MPASLSTIKGWIARAQEQGSTHLIVKCTGFIEEDCCYPRFVGPDDDVEELKDGEHRTMEVYSFTGKHTVQKQLAERRAFHLD